jgi:hypothetical protein
LLDEFGDDALQDDHPSLFNFAKHVATLGRQFSSVARTGSLAGTGGSAPLPYNFCDHFDDHKA